MTIEIPIGDVTRDGLDPSALSVIANGVDSLYVPANDGNVIVLCENAGLASAIVTFHAAASVAGVTFSDVTLSIPPGESRWVGTFPPVIFSDGSGRLNVTVQVGASLLLSGLRI